MFLLALVGAFVVGGLAVHTVHVSLRDDDRRDRRDDPPPAANTGH